MVRLIRVEQQLEVSLSRTNEGTKATDIITIPTTVKSLDNITIELIVSLDNYQWFNSLRPNRVLTVQNGSSEGFFTFKSKILARELTEHHLLITIEVPRIMASKERRRGPRIPLNVPVVYQIISFRERKLTHLTNKVGMGESQDLSKGGITLLTDLQLPVGMNILVEFTLDGEPLSLISQVCRVFQVHKNDEHFSIGLKFIEPAPKDQEIITRAISNSGERFKGRVSL